MKGIKISIFTILFFLIALQVYSFGLEGIELNTGKVWIGNTNPKGTPSETYFFGGLSFPVEIAGVFYINLEARTFLNNYSLLEGVPVLQDEEYADYAVVVNILFTPNLVLYIPASTTVGFGLEVAPGFLFPIVSGPLYGKAKEYKDTLQDWFYAENRFLYGSAALFLQWNMDETMSAIFKAKGYLPLYRLLNNQDLNIPHGLMIEGYLGVRFRFTPIVI